MSKEKEAPKKEKAAYKVVQPFIDAYNSNKRWEVGEDVSSFDNKRLEKCIERGLVKKS